MFIWEVMQVTENNKFKRIVLKLSGEALAGEKGFGIDPEVVYSLAAQIKDVVATGIEVAVVNGGGGSSENSVITAKSLGADVSDGV